MPYVVYDLMYVTSSLANESISVIRNHKTYIFNLELILNIDEHYSNYAVDFYMAEFIVENIFLKTLPLVKLLSQQLPLVKLLSQQLYVKNLLKKVLITIVFCSTEQYGSKDCICCVVNLCW